MKHHATIAALLLMLPPVAQLPFIQWQNAQAADAQGVFNVLGPGTDTCEEFVDAASPDDGDAPWTRYNLYTAYATGYLTGYNEFVDGTVDIRGQRRMLEIMGMIQVYCEEHPSTDLHAGLAQVVETLEPYRQRDPDEAFSDDAFPDDASPDNTNADDSSAGGSSSEEPPPNGSTPAGSASEASSPAGSSPAGSASEGSSSGETF